MHQELSDTTKWRRLLAWLRREFPSHIPVVIRSRPVKKNVGNTLHYETHLTIIIDSNSTFTERVDALQHEWAHILVLPYSGDLRHHGDAWGMKYASIYDAWLVWNFGRGVCNDKA